METPAGRPPDIELICELSPMQQAMLFHSLYAPGSGVYVLQMSLRLTGRLNIAALERAWRQIVARHGILRTAFFWDGLEQPAQVVYRQAELTVERASWIGLDAGEQRARLARFLQADRERGFDPSEAPLMRLTLIELAPQVHQLVWTQHHLVVDGWSQGQVLRELLAAYTAFSGSGEPRLERPRGYRDYIAWLQRQDLGQAESFWRRRLAGFTTPTFVANGNGRGEGPTHREAGRRDLTLEATASAALREVARRHRLTLNTLVQGAWAVLLARETGREDVVFGATVAGRPADLPGVESIVGPFINTLPLRVEVRPERRLWEWLAGLQQSLVEMRRYEHSPLVDVQKWSELPGGVPLFDHILVFENLALPQDLQGRFPELEVVEEEASSLANYPLTVVALPSRELTLSLRYDAGHLETTEVARLSERLARLLTRLAEGRDGALEDLPLLLEGERQQLLWEHNDTRCEDGCEASLPALFAAQVAASPEAPAVVEADGEMWTYRRLDEASSHLARHLLARGVEPGARVAVAMERSAELIVALLAVLKAGAAYVPLDPEMPEERRAFVLQDTGAAVVLSPASPASLESLRSLPSLGTGGLLAYIIYTSGSTGKPKGVAVSQRAVVRLVRESAGLQLGPDDRLAFNANPGFDAATFEIWAALLSGACLVVISHDLLLDPAALAEHLERQRVTVLHLTAAVFAQVAREAPAALSRPRLVLFGGEASAPAAVARALEAGRPRRLLQMYGPTESTTFATWQPVTAVPPGALTVPIGRPLANTTAYVLDRRQGPALLEQTGELFLGGGGLAWGYWNRPELTAERFVPDPWSAGPGGRLYRTGDLVRRRADGVLEFQGRLDDQVKIRGFRIEPGEVEAVLGSHPQVRECAVVVREDVPGSRLLAAYVVGESTADLRGFLKERLPESMVPSAWVFLKALPLTRNGKVDRKALPAPVRSAEGSAAPADPVEELVAGIWTEVLGGGLQGRVGPEDDFFALGGHSLLATQVMSRLRDVLGVELPLRRLFETPTVAALAREVREARQGGAPAPPVTRVPREGDPPLSFAQQRLWLIDQLEPGSPAYNMPSPVRLRGDLSPPLLERIFAEIVRRHEALRTTFEPREGGPVQVIADSQVLDLPLIDLSGLPDRSDRSDLLALALAREESARPFDLQRGPLLRMALVRLAERDHLLLLTMHHIVSDGWSMGVLRREIMSLHAAFSVGLPSPLPELPVQYADFAVWQRGRLQGEALAAQLGWWRQELAGAPGELALPTDRLRAPLQSREAGTAPLAFPSSLASAVRELAVREGGTPFLVLLAAFQTLLSRLSHQEDVLVGTPVANRRRLETEGLIGFFVNTLVLRGRLAARELTFRELLAQTRETVLAAFEHQDLPFERLVEELAPERNLAVSPLFQVFFSLNTAVAGPVSLPGLTLEPLAVHSGKAQFDLSLDLAEAGGEIRGALEVTRALFDLTTARRMLQAFLHLLHGAVAEPERRISAIPLLDAAERHQVLREWSQDGAPPAAGGSILPLFARRAALAPDAPALRQEGRRFTYRELDRWSGRLARRLRRLGVGPETPVAVVAERSPELIAAFLGILKAGGAYVPLDPAYPAERRAFMLADSGAVLLEDCKDEKDKRDEKDGHAPEAGQLAYVLYTSGSTGRPKGVMGSHGALARYAEAVAPVYGIGPGDRVLQFCSTSFDTSVEEIVACLTAGAELVLRTDAMLASPAAFLEACGTQGITVLSLPTAWWHEIAAKLETDGLALPPCLRLVIIGGERALPERVTAWRRRAPDRPRLLNSYGVTESTIVSTAAGLATPSPAEARGEVSIGRAIDGTEIHVLDREMEPVPIGVAGELLLGGGLLARGYLGRPDLTAERFVPHPFAPEPGARLYRTGDLARALPDGTLELRGRADRQVKVRGYRIEIEEIEARLLRHPEVESALVLVREDRPGEKRIAAYVVPRQAPGPAPAALRAFVREALPDHMVPTAWVALAALPMSPNGKLDRAALPEPGADLEREESFAAPSDPVEEVLTGIWAELLGRERVGIDDDFFVLGGHSLLAAQVVSRIRAVFGTEIPLRQVFEAPTVAGLARAVRASREETQPPLERVPRDASGAGLPLSFAQQRLWLIDQLEPGNPAYNMPLAVRLAGEVSRARLERIFAAIVRRHEALRTTFDVRDGRPVQRIAPAWSPEVPLIDLSDLSDRSDRLAREIALAEARQPFDLRRGPLLRLALVRLGPREHVLLITLHHIVSDGWSMGVLVREIAALHGGATLPELPVQYADFTVWQRRWLQGEVLGAQLGAWKRRLAGAPHVLELPTDRPRPALQSTRGATCPAALHPDLSAAIRTLCRQEGVTPFMAFLAAWALLLGRRARQDDLLVGSPIAGRNRREIEDLIGFFVNTLVLRVELRGSTFRELLGRVRETALDAFAHQDVPFELLVDELAVERSLAHSPLFQVMLALQNVPVGELRIPGLTFSPVDVPGTAAKFDLSLSFAETAEGFAGGLEYATDLFDRTTAERFLGHLANLLASAVEDPGQPHSELRLMDAAEEQLLRTDLNRADRTWALPVTVHDLLARQAGSTPDRIAVAGPQGAMTYREIADRSSALAIRLAGPLDRRIGLLLDPGPEVLVGMLGILRAGAGFVPLDPRLPDDRLAWLLEDCACGVLVTQRRHLERAARLGPHRSLCLDDLGTAAVEEPGGLREPRSLAYVIYTSGSTGRPKGVQVSHESLVPMFLWGCSHLGLGEHTRVLQSLSFCFDFGVFELLSTLVAGGTLHFPGDAAGDPRAFAREIVRQHINTVHTTPVFARELAATGETLDSLEIVHLGGEALPRDTVQRLRVAAPRATLYNGYGPTEATVNSSIHRITGAEAQTVPIGRRSADNALYVLDPEARLVPFGARGELYVGGIGVARGYLGRPELTAERFVSDPFGTVPGGRLYRTGDLVRYLPGGDLEYLGRIDHQVKVRGFRIELGEIETVLRSHPSVRDCAVLARGNVLVAYTAGGTDVPALQRFLGERLPDYMVPTAWVTLESLPLTPNGKIDRKALPAPERSHLPETAPSDPVAELIAGIWAEVLGMAPGERIGTGESFFTLGGHSLLATQVISRIRGAFGVELPLRQLFETPTVAGLAAAVRTATGTPDVPPLVPVPREGSIPLSFAQQRLWLLDQLAPGSPAYNILLAVRLEGEVSPAALKRIFGEIVRRHEALRTTFDVRDGQPVQVIAPACSPAVPLIDLSDLSDRSDLLAREIVLAEAGRPFDLHRGPLLRLTLVRLGEREHLLLVNMHHIITDGWSLGVLVHEVGALYTAFSAGQPSPLPELPLQYAGFAIWQRSWLAGEVLAAQLDFWRRQLAGAPAVLELPLDRPRPAVPDHRGASRPMTLAPSLADAVRALCRRSGTTPFMVLLAAWAVVLGRSAHQEDVLLGSPIAGRTRREIEGLIGFFVNTLVLRIRLAGTPSPDFGRLLGQVRQTALDAFSHQDLPFERIVEEVVTERNLAVTPLFQAVFTLQNAPVGELALPSLSLSPVAVESRVAKFDLSLALVERAGGFAGSLEHSVQLFDGSTAQRLLARFEVLLEAAAREPERPLDALPLLHPAERHQTLLEWNDTEKPCPQVPLVHELVALHARRRPQAVAVDGVAGRLTYGELEARANRLAHHLRRLGVCPETLVALCTERTPERVVGTLAVLKAGGAYVSLDPAYPRERLAFLLDDARAPVLLTQRRFLDSLPESSARVICLDDPSLPDLEDNRAPVSGVGPDNLAYVVYTSGSTGRPKGVEIPHAGLMNLVRWHQDLYQVTPDDRGTQIASPAFDASLWELWPYLAAGASVHIPDEETRLSAPGMIRWWSEQGITLAYLMTPLAEAVLEERIPPDLALDVRALIIGGDRLHRGPDPAVGFRLMNHYGPSEYSVVSTVVAVPPRGQGPAVPTIGRPVDNTRIYLLDRQLEPVPIGVSGELFVAGVGIARGYLRRPELTAEKLVPDPFSAEPGARMYRTADLVRSLPDGEIDFLGRIDNQVKIRGLRIELGEIESVLGQHPGVREAVVLAREDRPGHKRLVAYLVPAAETPPADELRRFLTERLPEHMCPVAWVVLETLPLTPNGKVDRRALPAPAGAGGEEGEYAAPSDPVEELLAGIWAGMLGLDRVGVHDDFFILGGHSLLATQVVSRLRSELGTELPLRQIFETPTVAGLARAVRGARQAVAETPLRQVSRDGDLPLSFAQQRLWLLDQLAPGQPVYNIPFAVRLEGEVSPAGLERTFGQIVRRHEALRTTFDVRDGQPVQVIAPPEAAPQLSLIDLSSLSDRSDLLAREIALAEAVQPFDLRTGPLLRLALVRLAGREHLLLLTMHHIVSDGWSTGVLLREIAALHEATALPELPVQYADFAVWQRGWLAGEVLDAQLASARRRLAGAPHVLELPTDRPRPAVQTGRGTARPLSLPPGLSAALRTLCGQEGVTPFMALLAAWTVVLGRHANQDDVLVGSPIAGRNRREIEDLIGLFVNTLVLRTELRGTFRELLGRVRGDALEAFSHQDLPFELLVDELAVERSLAHTPLFQVMLVLQNALVGALRLPGLILSPLDAPGATAKFDLTLSIGETAEGFAGSLEYATDLFDGTTAERFLDHFASLLASAAADPGQPLGELRLMGTAEERMLQTGLNRADRTWALPVTVHDLFARQAGSTPDRIAAAGPPGAMTYREIAERSRALAIRLAGPLDRRIGLLLDPGPQALVGMIGILQAGAGFVPLDPRHPDDRLAWLLEDCACEVLVTQRRHLERAARLGPHRILCLDDLGTAAVAEPGGLREPRSLAYVIYTSGSTGKPKGVQISHESLVPMLLWGCSCLGLGERTRVLQSLSFCFDFGIFELLSTLVAGGTLHFPGDAAGDPQAFAREIVRQQIDTLHTTPAFARELAAAGETLASLEIVHLGGEALPGDTVERLREAAPRATLYNGYGPTEATVNSSIHRIAGAEAQTITIGRRSADNALYVLDQEARLVPFGARGELYVGGIGVARGYLGRPELTAERFAPDPFGTVPGGRLYRTGDLVRYLSGGDLEYLGRIDHQVKLRGFRIELGEIETVLRSHPSVRDCAVLAREGALVAYTAGGSDAAALRSFLGERLPDYMVPTAWVALESLPLTPNGKIDRRALPAPARSHVPETAPSDPVEELLSGILAEVLGLDRVGAGESFFTLGGHSLLAAQVVSRIRGVLGMELPLRQIFETPTVAELAAAVRTAAGTPAAPPLLRVSRRGDLPLSFAQQRLWLLDQLAPGQPVYNIPFAVRLEGEVSPAGLERTFGQIVRRHEALRTTFDVRDGQPVQVIAPPEAAPQLSLIDLSGLSDRSDRSDLLAREIALAEAVQPFDLRTGPLLRLALVRLDEREHLLLLTMHHIVSDGWSTGVLLREIAALHQATALPELPVQYADFAVWQRGWLTGEVLDAQLASARRRLAGAPHVLELATDRPRPAVQTGRGTARPVSLPSGLSAALRTLCGEEGVTPFMALLTAWAVVLGRNANQDDVLVGSPIAGRNRREIEDLIGLFVNTLVLRTGLHGTFRELLGRVRGDALEAYSHQDLPFELLVDELAVERSLAHTPLFQVMLALQNAPVGALRLPGLTLSPLDAPGTTAKFDLALSLGETAEGFAGSLEYATDLFDGTTAERFLDHFTNLLASAASDPGQPLGELRLMGAAEERLLQTGLNRADRTWALPVTVHDLFALQAGSTPDRIAAAGPQGAMTYRETAERSSALAIRLAGPLDRRIGLLLDPGPQALVGMLGILQAGGGFVPLDPRHPDDRLAWLLEDCACEVLVTQRRHLERAARLGPHRILCLDDLETAVAGETRGLSEPRALAYVIYTSGSTGRPKGVQVSHESLVPMLLWGCSHLGLGERTRVLQSLSFCFDFGIFEYLTTVLAGGTLVFPGEEAAGDPEAFAREIVRHGIDTLHTTPAFARELAATGETLDSLEVVHLGGEALSRDTVERVRRAAPRATLYNGYGPTEATINSSIYRIDGAEDAWPVVPIGRRSADNALYVLDHEARLVPFGARGELHVGGIGVARGYLDRPELTAERFVPDPFGTVPGGRLYRTGDLVRYLSGGDVEYLGRIDHQVKVRGFRIELGEIETILRSHPSVRDCAVLAREGALVAYTAGGSDAAALRSFLGERLPDYMVPTAWVALESLPLTPNGKIDRRALPAPERASGPEHLGPRDDLEWQVVRIWEEVLGVHPVGVRDDFFSLGGHSLLAARLTLSLRQRLGRSLPLAAVLRHPTVEGLAALLRQEIGPLPRSPLVELAPGDGKPLFLIHPVGGEVLCYVPLARRLGRPVQGLQAPEESLTTLEEMADLYLRHVRAAQPEGPYALGGWSLGGVVAFEMARQLEARGETVERVVLIDSFAPGATAEEPLSGGALVASFTHDLARLLGLGLAGAPAGLAGLETDAALRRLCEQAQGMGILPPGMELADLEQRFSTFAANHRAMARYRGGPANAPLLLIRAGEPASGEPDRGWSRLSGNPVEVDEIPGDHYALLREPAVERLASLLRERARMASA